MHNLPRIDTLRLVAWSLLVIFCLTSWAVIIALLP